MIYNKLDLKRVINGTPWCFSRHLLQFHRLEKGENPMQVPLFFFNFWVQIHNFPVGSMSVGMEKQLGDFIGNFIDYDSSIIMKGEQKYMTIRVCLDVRLPLKRRKRVIY